MRRRSRLEDMLEWQLVAEKIPYVKEFQFAAPRRWRFDFVVGYPRWIAVECEGITRYGRTIGRHQSAKGFENDAEKYNEATIRNWRLIRVTEKHIKSGQAMKWIKELLEN